MKILQLSIEEVGGIVDAIGVMAIIIGILFASIRSILPASLPAGLDRYSLYRQRIGRSILLGLELLVAGDIIRTVAVAPTLQDLAVLAGIVIIRTFLSFTLELEISGRWPWQKEKL